MRCYLCNKNTAGYFIKARGRQQIKCSSCGLVYVDNKLRRKSVVFNDEKFLKEYLLEEDRYRDYFTPILDFIEKIKNQGRLLDIGCGLGTFLSLAKKRGWKVLGIDSSRAAISYAKTVGIKVVNKRVGKEILPQEKFDVVTTFQTVEHFTDPIKVLEAVRKNLKPKGLLAVSTPNGKSLLERFMGRHWFGYYNREHLFVFDKKSFELLVQNAGFEIIRSAEEQGRMLSLSWVLTRLSDYYYDHHSFARKIIRIILPISKYFNWFKIKEPLVDLLIIAKKK